MSQLPPTLSPETKSFLGHLEDLRWTLIRCLGALVVGITVCAFLLRPILELLYRPLRAAGRNPSDFLFNLGVVDPFGIHVEISVFGGIILTLPLLLYFIADFILPALTAKERSYLAPVFFAGAVLFLTGVCFCYFLVLRAALAFFINYSAYEGYASKWTAKGFIDFEVQMMAGFGLAFELPLVILVLNLLGLVSAAQLASKRRHALIVIFFTACCIIPSTDLFSLGVLCVPMYLLYEVCITIGRIVERRRARAEISENRIDGRPRE